MIKVKGGVQVSVGFVVACEGTNEASCTPACTSITISGNKHLIPATETSITINVNATITNPNALKVSDVILKNGVDEEDENDDVE